MTTETDPQTQKSNRRLIYGVFAFFSLPIVALVVIMGIGAIAGSQAPDRNNSREAIAECQAHVKDMLKAPATASFDSSATGDGTWDVRGTVDADNSYGATVRSSFRCTVAIVGDSAATTVHYLD